MNYFRLALVLILPVKQFMIVPSSQVDGCAAIAMPLAISSLSNHFKTFPASECPGLPLFIHYGLVNGLRFLEGSYFTLTSTRLLPCWGKQYALYR